MGVQKLYFMLIKNPFKSACKFIPRIVNRTTIPFHKLLSEMEKTTAIRRGDHRLSLKQLERSLVEYMTSGNAVQTSFGTFKVSIRGSFKDLEEDFRPGASTNNHSVKIMFTPSPEFAAEVESKLETERVDEASLKYPTVRSYENKSTPAGKKHHSTNILIFKGINLKFDEAAEDEGVFWTDKDGNSVRTDCLTVITAKKLHFQIPELAPGEYTVSIATRLGNHKLRSASLDDLFTVA